MMKKKHGGAAKKAEAGARMAAAHAKRMEDFSLSLGFHMLPGYCGLRYGRPTAGTKLFELKRKSEENRLVPLKLCRHC